MFNTYFTFEGVSRMATAGAARPLATPRGHAKDQWLGQYALPVPESVATPSAGVSRSTADGDHDVDLR